MSSKLPNLVWINNAFIPLIDRESCISAGRLRPHEAGIAHEFLSNVVTHVPKIGGHNAKFVIDLVQDVSHAHLALGEQPGLVAENLPDLAHLRALRLAVHSRQRDAAYSGQHTPVFRGQLTNRKIRESPVSPVLLVPPAMSQRHPVVEFMVRKAAVVFAVDLLVVPLPPFRLRLGFLVVLVAAKQHLAEAQC